MSALAKGLKVRVYQKPVTKEKYEGVAVLQEFEGAYPDDGQPGRVLHCWFVQFNDGCVVSRWVSPDDIVEDK